MLISRMTNDVEALDSLVTDTVVTLFQASLTLVGSVAILLYLDVQLALLTFLIFPVMAIGSLAFRIASADAYRRTRETISAITVYLQETLSGIRVVRAFAQEPRHRAHFAELNDVNRDANLVTVNLNAAYFPAVEFVAAVATVGILIVGGRQAINGDIEIGVLVGFIAALNGFFDPIGQLSQVYTTYQSGMAALDKIFELLDVTPELTDRPDAHRARAHPRRDPLRGRLLPLPHRGGDEARARRRLAGGAPRRDGRARRRHRRGQVDLRQARRALLRPDRRARARRRPRPARRGRAIAALADGDRARRRPSCSAARSPTTSPSAARTPTRREIEAAARAVGAWDFIAALPDGPATPRSASAACSSRPASASSLAFARALIADPRILVLDEADLERRPAHRGPHRGGPAAAARRAHGDRHRPPPVDHPPVRADRRARPGPDRRAGHATTSSSRPTARTRRCTPTGRRRRRRERRVRVPAPPTADDAERMVAVTVEGFETYRAFAPGGLDAAVGRRRGRAPGGAARRGPRLVPRRRARRRARRPRRLPARRPAHLRAGRRPGARALPPALRRARALGHRPRHRGCTPRRSTRRAPAASRACGCSRRRDRSARGASTSARAGR